MLAFALDDQRVVDFWQYFLGRLSVGLKVDIDDCADNL